MTDHLGASNPGKKMEIMKIGVMKIGSLFSINSRIFRLPPCKHNGWLSLVISFVPDVMKFKDQERRLSKQTCCSKYNIHHPLMIIGKADNQCKDCTFVAFCTCMMNTKQEPSHEDTAPQHYQWSKAQGTFKPAQYDPVLHNAKTKDLKSHIQTGLKTYELISLELKYYLLHM